MAAGHNRGWSGWCFHHKTTKNSPKMRCPMVTGVLPLLHSSVFVIYTPKGFPGGACGAMGCLSGPVVDALRSLFLLGLSKTRQFRFPLAPKWPLGSTHGASAGRLNWTRCSPTSQQDPGGHVGGHGAPVCCFGAAFSTIFLPGLSWTGIERQRKLRNQGPG